VARIIPNGRYSVALGGVIASEVANTGHISNFAFAVVLCDESAGLKTNA
jgi:hypothetical protein